MQCPVTSFDCITCDEECSLESRAWKGVEGKQVPRQIELGVHALPEPDRGLRPAGVAVATSDIETVQHSPRRIVQRLKRRSGWEPRTTF